MLFTQHAVYTKFYIESALQSLPDLTSITTRLYQNQTDIGNYVKPIVGATNGDTLTTLLKGHISAVAGAVSAIKGKDQTIINAAVNKVFVNSAQVAGFISSLNPSKLPYNTVLKMFNAHNQYVIDMTMAHSQNQYDRELQLFDEYYQHMMMFSDSLSGALIRSNDDGCWWSMCVVIVVIILLVIWYLYSQHRDTSYTSYKNDYSYNTPNNYRQGRIIIN